MGKIYKNGIEYGGGGGDSAGHIILDDDGTAMAEEPNLQFKGLNVTDNSTDEVTEVESVGLNQDSMDDVLNASISGNQVASNGMSYSTEEQVVGKWIDGKPLYQKTYVTSVPSTPSAGEYARVDIDISNLNASYRNVMTASFINPSEPAQAVSGPQYTSNGGGMVKSHFWNFSGAEIEGEWLVVGNSLPTYSNWDAYVTIQYTKTTD